MSNQHRGDSECGVCDVPCTLTLCRHQLTVPARPASGKDTHTFVETTKELLAIQTEGYGVWGDQLIL